MSTSVETLAAATARLFDSQLKERGYTSAVTVYYDLALDMMSYSFHDNCELKDWSEQDREMVFIPDSMRQASVDVKEEIRSPEEFYFRPHLHREKFPQDRRIKVPADVEERIRTQDAAGHLVFE